MIRCVGAALRGDGNPPEVPVIRTVLRAYNGVFKCPHQAHECRTLCAQMSCLPERLCEAKYSELYPRRCTYKRWASPVCKCALSTSEDLYLDSEKGMMVLSSGRCAPCSLASSIEDSTSRPSELRKRTLVLVLGQVVLTEPLRFRLGHPMDHSNAAGSSLVASLPEMRTARSRMSIDGICVQVRGNVQLGVSLARNSIWQTSTKGEAHFCISRVRNAVAQQKAASRRFKFCWGNIAARIRSLNFVGKVTGVPVPVLAQTPF